MRRWAALLAVAGASALLLGGVTKKRGPGGHLPIVPAGAAPAATCVVGELFLDTDETNDTNCTTGADNSLCACIAANTWETTE